MAGSVGMREELCAGQLGGYGSERGEGRWVKAVGEGEEEIVRGC
jgi:hypothetical protein